MKTYLPTFFISPLELAMFFPLRSRVLWNAHRQCTRDYSRRSCLGSPYVHRTICLSRYSPHSDIGLAYTWDTSLKYTNLDTSCQYPSHMSPIVKYGKVECAHINSCNSHTIHIWLYFLFLINSRFL